MDYAIYNYTQSFVLADRIEWAEEIQAILYEDLPHKYFSFLLFFLFGEL